MARTLNYHLGSLLNRIGYRVMRNDRIPQCTLNILKLGIRFLQSKKETLTIIQIGAFDGELADPLKNAFLEATNRVILVEPQSKPYEILVNKYSDFSHIFVENSAVGEIDGELELFLPKGEQYSPIASLDSTHLSNFGIKTSAVKSITVNSITVTSLLRNYEIDSVDVLQIDTEGFDFQILTNFFNANVEPLVINLEVYHLSRQERTDLRKILRDRDYQYVEHGFDLFALKSEALGKEL